MEAVGAGAHVLAFVILGLKSVKFINEVILAVKDGRGYVDQSQRAVQGLQSTLGRLERYRAVTERPDGAFVAKTKSCVDDMKAIAEKLQTLVVKDIEPSLGR